MRILWVIKHGNNLSRSICWDFLQSRVATKCLDLWLCFVSSHVNDILQVILYSELLCLCFSVITRYCCHLWLMFSRFRLHSIDDSEDNWRVLFCRPLQRSTNSHLHCCVMKATKLGKSGESQETFLVHYLEDRLMCLTRMEWFNSYITTSSNLKSILMRHWSYFKVFKHQGLPFYILFLPLANKFLVLFLPLMCANCMLSDRLYSHLYLIDVKRSC